LQNNVGIWALKPPLLNSMMWTLVGADYMISSGTLHMLAIEYRVSVIASGCALLVHFAFGRFITCGLFGHIMADDW
jgi:hypothetical protein